MRPSRFSAVVSILLVLSGAAALASGSSGAAVNLDPPTWSEDVAPILYQNCVHCHRPGQIGPMSLRTYDEARPWARSIAKNVADRVMPPWHASGGSAKLANDRSLDQKSIDTIVSWARSGAPAGDLEHSPGPPTFPDSEWQLGEPDFVVTLDRVDVPAGGPDQFHDLVGKVGLPEDRWVRAIEILPGNSKVVHHVIVVAIKGFDVDPQDGWLGAWAAGTEPMIFPEGTGRLLPKGSNVVADMHYHPTETAESDVTRIGLYFADPAPAKELTNLWAINASFEIPAGADNYEVRSSYRFWQSGSILSFAPHMHYRGKDFEFIAHRPDGSQETLLRVDNYDFNWQTWYRLTEPIHVSEGTVIECIAHFDNSAANPDNPDPTKNVRFGDESYDEMMIGFLDFVTDEGVRPLEPKQIRTRKLAELASEHPGEVFAVSGKPADKRTEPDSYAPLYLPKQGDGVFYVIWNDQLQDSRVHDLTWDGTSFSAKLESPWGDFDLTGKLQDGKVEATIHLSNGRTSVWDGELVSGG